MGLLPGDRFGPYDIIAPLGAGGMGEVYRARDSRLGRDVALKTLPATSLSDPIKLQRFEAEARAASALNHPNVLAIFDVGREGDTPFLVTELLEGQTLRERLDEGPITPRKVVELAMHLAQGLAAVHEKGIVHRDLKPENIFITRDGQVKILDFGVARASESATPPAGTLPLTQSGAVMGTAGYMSPEQVRGRPADARSDLFSLGAIVYECLTGAMAFPGESPVERGYAILNAEPRDVPEGLPGPLVKVMRRCLEKDPSQRFQHARDVSFALEATSTDSLPVLPLRKPSALRFLPWAVALVGFGTAALVIIQRPLTAPSAATAPTARRVSFRNGKIGNARFSSDGRSIIYGAAFENTSMRVYAGVLDGSEIRSITAPGNMLLDVTERDDVLTGATTAETAWSGYVVSRSSLAGGAARQIYDGVLSADVGADGSTLLVRRRDGMYLLEYPAGTVILRSANCVSQARLSPDQKHIAYVRQPVVNDDRGSVEIIDLQGTVLATSASAWTMHGLAWPPEGREVWFSAGFENVSRRIYALSLKNVERQVYGGPANIRLEDIDPRGRVLASTGIMRTRMFGKVGRDPSERSISWLDGSMPVDLSADGNAMLFIEGFGGAGPEIQTWFRRFDQEDDTPVLLSNGIGKALSPDTKWAIIAPTPPFNTLRLVPTGIGTQRDLPAGSFKSLLEVRYFADGQRIVFTALDETNQPHLYLQSLSETDAELGAPKKLSDEALALEGPPSPDGQWLIAYRPSDKRGVLVSVDGKTVTPLEGLRPRESPTQWNETGDGLWLVRRRSAQDAIGLEVSSYALETQNIEHFADIHPADPMGMESIKGGVMTPDGKHYAFTAHQDLDELYVIEGAR